MSGSEYPKEYQSESNEDEEYSSSDHEPEPEYVQTKEKIPPREIRKYRNIFSNVVNNSMNDVPRICSMSNVRSYNSMPRESWPLNEEFLVKESLRHQIKIECKRIGVQADPKEIESTFIQLLGKIQEHHGRKTADTDNILHAFIGLIDDDVILNTRKRMCVLKGHYLNKPDKT